ncbi:MULTISPECIES: MFS transporter [unclassified Sphingopyxis]|uniref:MFS transporter n=1 Tax=unclassified Sphingopyxis TaxID=2614943 RepID=UPI002855514B|nr:MULTISPECIES: MFS transporter [unclassified Sphingopyxis]MDR7058869.1 ACS family hexuronate transporter-like MFS transporter [Sphingopyxis sp. BE235]MDR7178945.1 ACS family hexuronate transporter-like MFS transporter [Sphingopyxis sp. BE249]
MSNIKGRFRWCVIALIALATVINYIDRNALAVMWPEVSKEIGATKEDYALLVTIFMIFYAFGQSIFGRIFDAIGTRMGFTISIVVWSLSIAAHALVRSMPLLLVLRATLGISEAGNWPGAAKANALWFPSRERALAQGIFNAGASLGGIISAPLIALLFVQFGWHGTFLLIGVLGFIWLVPWLWFYKADPEKHPGLSEEERDYILTGRTEACRDDSRRVPLGELLRYRQSWGVILSRFFLDPVWWLFVSWLPIYLAETFGFDVKQIGLFAWVPFVGAMLGSLFGGWLAGRIISKGGGVHKARTLTIAIGCAIMLPSLLFTIGASEPLSAVLLIACILFGFQMAIGNIQTLPSDYFGGGAVGSLAGISGTAAVAGTLITTWLVPVLTKTSYAPIFALSAAIVPVSFLCFWLIGGRVEPVVTQPTNTQE